MGYYSVGGNQGTISSSYKGAAASFGPASTPRRHKVFEIIIGATGNPMASDTYIQVDLGRLTGTTSVAGTSFTPNPNDLADAACLTTCLVNITTEVAAALLTAASSLLNFGINQRGTTRWVASQESQYIIAPATSANGLYLRALSNVYTGALAAQYNFQE